MELGNLAFGHSRGIFQVPYYWEEPFFELQEMLLEDCSPYGTEFENDVFEMHVYWWGDCSCSKGDDSDEHEPNCGLVRPNFRFKATGFELMFYKYALRDSYMNQKIDLSQWLEMIRLCKESIGGQEL